MEYILVHFAVAFIVAYLAKRYGLEDDSVEAFCMGLFWPILLPFLVMLAPVILLDLVSKKEG